MVASKKLQVFRCDDMRPGHAAYIYDGVAARDLATGQWKGLEPGIYVHTSETATDEQLQQQAEWLRPIAAEVKH